MSNNKERIERLERELDECLSYGLPVDHIEATLSKLKDEEDVTHSITYC